MNKYIVITMGPCYYYYHSYGGTGGMWEEQLEEPEKSIKKYHYTPNIWHIYIAVHTYIITLIH